MLSFLCNFGASLILFLMLYLPASQFLMSFYILYFNSSFSILSFISFFIYSCSFCCCSNENFSSFFSSCFSTKSPADIDILSYFSKVSSFEIPVFLEYIFAFSNPPNASNKIPSISIINYK